MSHERFPAPEDDSRGSSTHPTNWYALTMAIPKKGSRRICVNGVDYRYIARELSPGVRITVQQSDPPGSVLVLKSDQDRAVAHVPPSQIAALIHRAVRDGWDPHQAGAPFEQAVAL